jgi:ANTAR domain
MAGTLADVATIGILQERAVRQQEVVDAQLQATLHRWVMIEQAKGVLAERHRVTPDEAFLVLRRYARNHNRPLTALAGDVIHGTADISPGSQATTRPALHDEPENSLGPQATSGPHS